MTRIATTADATAATAVGGAGDAPRYAACSLQSMEAERKPARRTTAAMLSMVEIPIVTKGIQLDIKDADGKQLGYVEISDGGITGYPRSAQTRKVFDWSWTELFKKGAM